MHLSSHDLRDGTTVEMHSPPFVEIFALFSKIKLRESLFSMLAAEGASTPHGLAETG